MRRHYAVPQKSEHPIDVGQPDEAQELRKENLKNTSQIKSFHPKAMLPVYS